MDLQEWSDDDPSVAGRAGRSGWLRLWAELAGIAAICVLVWVFHAEILAIVRSISLFGLVLAIILAISANLVLSVWYWQLLSSKGQRIPFPEVCGIFLLANISKYIPGKIASFLHQYLLFGAKVSLSHVILANIELLVLTAGITTITGVTLISAHYSPLFLIPGVLLIYFYGRWLIHQNLLLAVLQRLRLTKIVRVPNDRLLAEYVFGALAVVFAVLYVAAHAAILDEMQGVSASQLFYLVGLFALSWVIGTISIIFPAGIGVREFAFVTIGTFISGVENLPDLAGMAVAIRIWQVLYELIGAAIGVIVIRRFAHGRRKTVEGE